MSASLSLSSSALRRRVGQPEDGVESVGDKDAVDVGGEGWGGVVSTLLLPALCLCPCPCVWLL